ncbi:type II toxin-antitoxin system RelE/ParE family toxin [Salibaculum griseiflavum]|uniref:Plasmid stabilization protein n=1 Tax=Salibaculum griseiflavum TaxID=1914409 RepID=A0A2V1P0T5_9RHOB|nr:type II toxin-antitoxin system RelE/ParE family toxin [Salibaculum griseiflavum]PWG16129.1 plasmid stabilization protein [Salibaculum griseiflavum]
MPQLIWSPAALKDVDRLYSFLSDKNQPAAQHAIRTIRGSLKILVDNPEAGRPMDHMRPEFREWLIPFGGSGYVALYRFDGDQAVLLAIRHQREAGY